MTLFISLSAKAFMPVTNEIDLVLEFSSYDTKPDITIGAYIAAGFASMYPQYTNSINSASGSGSSLEQYRKNRQPQISPAYLCYALFTNHVVPFQWTLANDNSAYNSNDVMTWALALASVTNSWWNGTADTNEGLALQVSSYMMGANPNDVAGCDGGAKVRNDGATNYNFLQGLTVCDLWTDNTTNGAITDQAGARVLGYWPGGHFYPAGGLGVFFAIWRQLVGDTNVGSSCYDWNANTVPRSNKWASIGMSHTTTSYSTTFRFDRTTPPWDLVGVISNKVAAPDCFAAMPRYGSVFQQVLQFTNMPTENGTVYNIFVDHVLKDTCTDLQLEAGRNWATNLADEPLNQSRTALLNTVYDKYGVGRIVHTNMHGAGENGVGNRPDLINAQSVAQGNFPAAHGPSLVNIMSPYTLAMRTNDVVIHDAAQQTTHLLEVIQVGTSKNLPWTR